MMEKLLEQALKKVKIYEVSNSEETIQLIDYAPKLFVPDFVIKFELPLVDDDK
jgi:hypothetical protein